MFSKHNFEIDNLLIFYILSDVFLFTSFDRSRSRPGFTFDFINFINSFLLSKNVKILNRVYLEAVNAADVSLNKKFKEKNISQKLAEKNTEHNQIIKFEIEKVQKGSLVIFYKFVLFQCVLLVFFIYKKIMRCLT